MSTARIDELLSKAQAAIEQARQAGNHQRVEELQMLVFKAQTDAYVINESAPEPVPVPVVTPVAAMEPEPLQPSNPNFPRVRSDATPITLISGPTRLASIIFGQYANEIKQETGIDVYERKVVSEIDERLIGDLIKKWRRDKTFSDEDLDEAWQDHLRNTGVLSDEEQQKKDEFTLARARATKDSLRGVSDAARFGYCKRKGCPYRKEQRLVIRGFCSDCRGVTVTQTIAEGGSFDATKPFSLNSTDDQAKTALTVTRKKPHKDTRHSSVEEKRDLVLTTKRRFPEATQRELATMTKVPRTTVRDILKQHIVPSH
jgi:hypothetical protein